MMRTIREEPTTLTGPGGSIAALVHPEWRERWPEVVQGTTTRASDFAPGPIGAREAGEVSAEANGVPSDTERVSAGARASWGRLSGATGCTSAVYARQPHETRVDVRAPRSAGFAMAPPADGHLTREPGVLLGVTVADCVPVTLYAPAAGVVGVVHAGWRSAAAGILERALRRLTDSFGVGPGCVEIHLGPSICGACYEVGPGVFAAMGMEVPSEPTPIDLRGAIAERAVMAGVDPARITRSAWCTLCSGGTLWSHRGGDAGRQLGFVALRRPASAASAGLGAGVA